MVEYHDTEWGVPEHDDRRLFELLTLEGAQAGLSWTTILRKREGYRAAFAGFDPHVVAEFTDEDVERLVADPAIVRHRGKIESTVNNARAVLAVQEEFGSFDNYVWGFVDGTPRVSGLRRARAASVIDRRVHRAQQRPEAARLPFRRPHHGLRVHAGRRPRRRPRRRLLPPP